MGRSKLLFPLFLTCCFCVQLLGQTKDSAIHSLYLAIDSSKFYDGKKIERIEALKKALQISGDKDLNIQYQNCEDLYEEYKSFEFDTAYIYAGRLTKLATQLNDAWKVQQAEIKTLFVLVSAGMFKEASEIIGKINTTTQTDSIKADYCFLRARYFFDLADYVNDRFHTPDYYKKGNEYLDSAIALFSSNSFEKIYSSGLKNLKRDSLKLAYIDFQTLLKIPSLGKHQEAIVASTLSYIYSQWGDRDKAIYYQVRAAIADIQSSTKETFAIFNLSQMLFEDGDFKNASNFIQKAIDDASFYGARQRKVQVSTIMPIIQSSQLHYVERERKNWIIYGGIVSAALLIVLILLVIIFRQNRKLAHARATITEANAKLQQANDKLTNVNEELKILNTQLTDVNHKLVEANKIKEDYIGYFFNINSTYFHKLERLKKTLEQKLLDRKVDEALFIVCKISISEEKEDLLKAFDRAFLKLFPNFVEQFNALFKEEDRIIPEGGEILNTDLRIYALIRLGIKENEKIAEILEYSVKSIYAYKTRIRNKAIVPKEEFEKMVMSIKSV
jgi:tetratricopeptide (TPR) repeat protein